MNHTDFKKKIEYITKRYSEKTAITYMTENGIDITFLLKDVYKYHNRNPICIAKMQCYLRTRPQWNSLH